VILAVDNAFSAHSSTGRQRWIRRRSCRLSLKHAIHLAADLCYGFKGRSLHGKALWSETERVWMGLDTFLHWSLSLADIDIPWAVATSLGAPGDTDRLRDEVQTELKSYFADRLKALPRQEMPNWLPLP
jgi:hypothetical protein